MFQLGSSPTIEKLLRFLVPTFFNKFLLIINKFQIYYFFLLPFLSNSRNQPSS